MRVLSLLLLVLPCAMALSVDFTDKEWKEKPVGKVVRLLKEMQTQLQKEQDNDQEIYDTMECWCETNGKAKTKAVADAEAHSDELQSNIEEYLAKSTQLKVEVEGIESDIAKNKDAMSEATAIRDKDAAEFNEEEKNAMVSITGLKNAVLVLSKEHALPQESLIQVQNALRRQLGKDSEGVLARLGLSPKQKRSFTSFLQQSAPPSAEIFGVLKGMKESFEQNLESSTADEMKAKNTYGQLKGAKTEELSASDTQLRNKKTELADANEKLAESRTDLEDTTKQLDADKLFLEDLKMRCENMDEMWAARSKVRNEEMASISEALDILLDDDARDVTSRSTFLQVHKSHSKTTKTTKRVSARDRAAEVLRKTGNPTISALAVMMKSDVMAKVKVAIDEMVVQLKKDQKDEVKLKDFCTEELYQNERQTTQKYDEKADLETRHADLTSFIAQSEDDIKLAQTEVDDTRVQMKRAGEDRAKENKEFQMTITDQQATQEILTKALDRLKAFYAKKAALVQASVHVSTTTGQAPPPGFGSSYKKSSGANSVMQMIQTIISESKTEEKDATEDEQASQTAYEMFIADSNKAIKTLLQEIADRTESTAKANEDKIAVEADLKAMLDTLMDLADMSKELHFQCDYTLKNFDARQAARIQEMDALNQAKAILSGAEP